MVEFIVKAEVKQIKGGKKGVFTPRVDLIRGTASEVSKLLDTKYSHPKKSKKGFANQVIKAFNLAGDTFDFIDWCLKNQEELEKIRQPKNG